MLKSPRFALVIAIAGPLAVTAVAESSAAPMNGVAIKAATPAVTTDVRYQADAARTYWDYHSSWNYPTYSYRRPPHRGLLQCNGCGYDPWGHWGAYYGPMIRSR